mmetsp:Transcript_17359/g.37965  ORF Transcript_17359/g.37965 Transcript_17359/m.37965 type:complete len:218 (-) Transcript_17359:187-840(-)
MLEGTSAGQGASPSCPAGLQFLSGLLSAEDSKKTIWIIEDLQAAHLHADQIHHSEACELHDLALALMSCIFARKICPVAPGEAHLGRSGEDFQNLPRETMGERLLEVGVRRLKGLLLRVIQCLLASIHEGVVVPHRGSHFPLEGLPAIGRNGIGALVHRLPLFEGLVRRLHLPSLHQIFHDELQRTSRMVLALPQHVRVVGHCVVRFPVLPADAWSV